MKAEHLNKVYPILNTPLSLRAQPHDTAGNHIAVMTANSYSFSIEDSSGSL